MTGTQRIVVRTSYGSRATNLVGRMEQAGEAFAGFELAAWREEAEKAGLPAEAIELIVKLVELELATKSLTA